ncbi:hypothetical protein C9975_03560 [Thalassospira xiamenensis]|nr:hypothetical protein C9975_03560 [Thalassospira xiamenensis]
MRWQLINKRIAALYSAALNSAYVYLLSNQLSAEDKKLFHGDGTNQSRWRDLFSMLFYVKRGFTKMDASVNGYPNFIAKRVESRFLHGSGADRLEKLMTVASLGIFAIVTIKIFFG